MCSFIVKLCIANKLVRENIKPQLLLTEICVRSLSTEKWILPTSHNNHHIQIISEIHPVFYPEGRLSDGSVFDIIAPRASN